MIQLIDIQKNFDGLEVLRNVNLTIPKNKITAVIGLSGSGKSVILKHMLGLMKPDRGRVLLRGQDIAQMNRTQLRNIRMSYSMLFQSAALLDSMTVFENVALPLKELTNTSCEEIAKKVSANLFQVGLLKSDFDKYPGQLSGGMRKRVGLARSLIMQPETILFDEPTTGLDPLRTKQIHELIKTTQRKFNITVVVVSHEIPKILYVADYAAVLHEGKIIEFDTSEKVLNSNNPIVSELVRGDMDV